MFVCNGKHLFGFYFVSRSFVHGTCEECYKILLATHITPIDIMALERNCQFIGIALREQFLFFFFDKQKQYFCSLCSAILILSSHLLLLVKHTQRCNFIEYFSIYFLDFFLLLFCIYLGNTYSKTDGNRTNVRSIEKVRDMFNIVKLNEAKTGEKKRDFCWI